MAVVRKKTLSAFDPNEIEGLLEKAKAGDLVARNELLFRFQRLVASLVNVMLTGRPNPRSYSQGHFLKLFGAKTTPITQIAKMLKIEMSSFDKKELFLVGQVAILKAIEKTTKNLAATVTLCMHDEIRILLKDRNIKLDEDIESVVDLVSEDFTRELEFECFLETLNDEDYMWVQNALEGNFKEKCSEVLKLKFIEYMTYPS